MTFTNFYPKKQQLNNMELPEGVENTDTGWNAKQKKIFAGCAIFGILVIIWVALATLYMAQKTHEIEVKNCKLLVKNV
jgi:hypothetical protein